MASVAIRSCRASDFDRLRAIEIDAFAILEAAGAVIGAANASTDEEFRHCLETGLLLAACDPSDIAIGYVGALFEGDCLHVEEIDVAPDWQRRGIGRALMQAVLAGGRERGLRAATLTTDRLAPFNAPFYATLGFRLLDDAELPDRLRAILASERDAGFDPARRVAMLRYFQP
jgi:N-acetylglutamate synthase-like GNAT family acetyltransferase